MLKRVILASVFAATCALAAASGQAAPVLSVGSAISDIGGTFTVQVSIQDAVNLTSFQFDLSYDPSILSVVGFTDVGTDFDLAATAGGGTLTGLTGFSLPGLLSGVADSMSGALSGLSGNGVLVDVTFQSLAAGVSPLVLSNAFLTDDNAVLSADNGDFGLQAGQVQVPVPGTLALLALGLGALGWKRRFVRVAALQLGAMLKSKSLWALMFSLIAVPALAQTPGPYYAVPSWDQTMACTTAANCPRFVVLSNMGNAAVLDRETGLVWEKSPSATFFPWASGSDETAADHCNASTVGNRRGWRLPTISELLSLIDGDPANTGGTTKLPPGHPFTNLQNSVYWSSTVDVASFPGDVRVTNLFGGVFPALNFNIFPAWCVRGRQGPGGQ